MGNYEQYHQTPLHCAVLKCRLELVKPFILHGANPYILDSEEQSALDVANDYSGVRHTGIKSYLIVAVELQGYFTLVTAVLGERATNRKSPFKLLTLDQIRLLKDFLVEESNPQPTDSHA